MLNILPLPANHLVITFMAHQLPALPLVHTEQTPECTNINFQYRVNTALFSTAFHFFYKVVLPKNNVAITRLPSAEYAPEQA